MAKTLWLYYLTNSNVKKEELQIKYTELEEFSKQYSEDSLTAEEQAQLLHLAQYTELYEEYHTTHSIGIISATAGLDIESFEASIVDSQG
ncbi:hypothetical protein [Paenibacillus sp. PK1-4R]|uniref:hypothetical protein n=1 Tax=Paenibacillus sp. PK1-4R TaxID=3049075 RepID=UPI0025A27ED7|nr:hypothetical protein [Paenibacillus sp. PK1-4R]WJM05888.1 hypothetical protein QNO02_16535 [Paenibacillus sp. PK1-4R]